MAAYIVTGGTGALGREVVRALLAGGASVAVPYRGEEGWQALRDEMAAGARLLGAPRGLARFGPPPGGRGGAAGPAGGHSRAGPHPRAHGGGRPLAGAAPPAGAARIARD